MQPERDHDFQGEKTETGEHNDRKWRHASDGGWLSFTMKTVPDTAQELHITYWGGDRGNRVFDILIDGKRIATQRLEGKRPNEFYDEVYPLSPELTRGKGSVVVRFQAQPGNTAGGIYGARLVRK